METPSPAPGSSRKLRERNSATKYKGQDDDRNIAYDEAEEAERKPKKRKGRPRKSEEAKACEGPKKHDARALLAKMQPFVPSWPEGALDAYRETVRHLPDDAVVHALSQWLPDAAESAVETGGEGSAAASAAPAPMEVDAPEAAPAAAAQPMEADDADAADAAAAAAGLPGGAAMLQQLASLGGLGGGGARAQRPPVAAEAEI